MIEWLQKWYLDRCNGDWEHEYGITIDTLDNPGWSLTIDLTDTHLETQEIISTLWEHEGKSWLAYSIKDKAFKGSCDPTMLNELIGVFKKIYECRDLNQLKKTIESYLNKS